jgi:hypothetical protein
VTISTGLLLLVVIVLAWKMKGVQLPHVLLGMMVATTATPGSFVDTIGVEAVELFNTVVNAVTTGLGQGNVV